MGSPAVFLDRDGTINEYVEYLGEPSKFKLLSRSAEAIKLLNKHGFKVIVTTNQAGVARGYFDEDTVKKIHLKMEKMLKKHSAVLDAIYYCPHHPDVGNSTYRKMCCCRKPEPGMIEQGARDFSIDLRRSYAVGDRIEDIIAGKKAGCTTILVLTGCGEQEKVKISSGKKPDIIANDLMDAVEWIIS